MKLVKSKEKSAKYGFPASCEEWWDFDDGYGVHISIGSKVCSFWVHAPAGLITYEIAKLLKLDVSEEHLVKRYKGNNELYASMSINTLAINYTKPESYQKLLGKIEEIVNEHFKK